MDREKVITHLQIIHTWADFARKRDLRFFTAKHLEDIAQWADDALELLKEQTEYQETTAEIEGSGNTWWFVCNECHAAIDTTDVFCRGCGRKVRRNADGQREVSKKLEEDRVR